MVRVAVSQDGCRDELGLDARALEELAAVRRRVHHDALPVDPNHKSGRRAGGVEAVRVAQDGQPEARDLEHVLVEVFHTVVVCVLCAHRAPRGLVAAGAGSGAAVDCCRCAFLVQRVVARAGEEARLGLVIRDSRDDGVVLEHRVAVALVLDDDVVLEVALAHRVEEGEPDQVGYLDRWRARARLAEVVHLLDVVRLGLHHALTREPRILLPDEELVRVRAVQGLLHDGEQVLGAVLVCHQRHLAPADKEVEEGRKLDLTHVDAHLQVEALARDHEHGRHVKAQVHRVLDRLGRDPELQRARLGPHVHAAARKMHHGGPRRRAAFIRSPRPGRGGVASPRGVHVTLAPAPLQVELLGNAARRAVLRVRGRRPAQLAARERQAHRVAATKLVALSQPERSGVRHTSAVETARIALV